MAAMIRLGLTGGIGMGKSTAAELLAKHGAKISDSDVIARELAEPGQPALQAIAEAFGNEVLRADGSLDRGRVAELVFGDDAARRTLEDILHPRIRATWLGNLDRWAREGVALGVAVIPLLYETGSEAAFDRIVCVACSPATQRERLRHILGVRDDRVPFEAPELLLAARRGHDATAVVERGPFDCATGSEGSFALTKHTALWGNTAPSTPRASPTKPKAPSTARRRRCSPSGRGSTWMSLSRTTRGGSNPCLASHTPC